MKKTIIAITLILALVCAAAFAESAYTYYPESEAYVGSWACGEYQLTINHTPDDPALFCCMVNHNLDEHRSEIWLYDGCAYDDIGMALTCEMIGVRSVLTFDDAGNKTDTQVVYNDGATSFLLNEDGQIVWTDFKESPGEDEMVFERVEETGEAGAVPEA